MTVVPLADIVRGEFAENMVRKPFTPSEEVAIYRALAPAEKQAAEARQQGTRFGGGNFPPPSGKGKTRDKVAKFVGKSGRTLEKQLAIVEAYEREPDKYAKLLADMDRTGRVNGPYKRLIVARKAEAIRREPPPLPGRGPYRVIVADPPWPYELRDKDPSHRGVYPYPAMSMEEIKTLDVASIAAPDSILWLWTTNFHMPEAFGVLAAWGFAHKTILTWEKPETGRGHWLLGQTEHCLFATRGKPVVTNDGQTTLLYGAVREHSRKPEEFYALVEKLCPAPRYAELFSRHQHSELWDCHGDEAAQPHTCTRRTGNGGAMFALPGVFSGR